MTVSLVRHVSPLATSTNNRDKWFWRERSYSEKKVSRLTLYLSGKFQAYVFCLQNSMQASFLQIVTSVYLQKLV